MSVQQGSVTFISVISPRTDSDRDYEDGTCTEIILEVDAVSICSGLHVTPAVPVISGIESLVPQSPPILSADNLPITPPGFEDQTPAKGVRVIHSSQYKHRAEFKDRKVLILGCGETGKHFDLPFVLALSLEPQF